MGSWLPLTDYSIKYKVSVSTLRRRIKTEDLKFRLQDGKYFIIDEPISTHQGEHRPSQDLDATLVGTLMDKNNETDRSSTTVDTRGVRDGRSERTDRTERNSPAQSKAFNTNNSRQISSRESGPEIGREEPVLAAANKLLNELKKAYSQILNEKEQQIMQLREEVADLKTLARVLEDENIRLRSRSE